MSNWSKTSKLASDMFHSLSKKRPQRSKLVAFDMFRNLSKKSPPESSSVPQFDMRRFKAVAYSGAAITFLCYSIDMNTYSDKFHFNVVPKYLENKLGEWKINKMKEEYKEGLMPPEHPRATRVRSIAKNLIESPILSFGRRCPLAKESPKFLNWELTVIDLPIPKACCYAGKIVIFTGLLDLLQSHAEIAAVIAHEIGHDWARHAGVKITMLPWIICLPPIYWYLREPLGSYKSATYDRFTDIETEADYLGGLLMASAGYDPRVAPTVHERLSKEVLKSDNCSERPSGVYRATLLSKPEVMGQLIFWYKNAPVKRSSVRLKNSSAIQST